MAFEPEKITRQHVLDAVEKIETEEIKLRASTGYDVQINGNSYPPKEIMRHAHKQMNGSGSWDKTGGEPTNKYLVALGFKIIKKELSGAEKPEYYDSWYPIVQTYCHYLAEEDYAPGTLDSYGKSIQNEMIGFLSKSMIEKKDSQVLTKEGITRILVAISYNFTGIMTFHDFLFINLDRSYWALGFNSSHEDLKSFKENNNWYALHYDRSDESRGARMAHRYFDEIEIGDLIIIKGYGGSGDLTVHYAGMVKTKDTERKVLEFYPMDKNFHKGKAPTGPGAGNWHNTIVPIRRYADIELLFGESPVNAVDGSNDDKEEGMEQLSLNPLNLILYGPPGTGKTYATKAYALSLLHDGTLGQFENKVALRQESINAFKTEWLSYKENEQVEFVTFHQSFSYEDFVQGIRPDIKGDGIKFKLVDGTFKKICHKAEESYRHSLTIPEALPLGFEELFDILISPLMEEGDEIAVKMSSGEHTFYLTNYDEETGRIEFRKQSGGTSHKLLKSNIRDIYLGNLNYRKDGLGHYYHPLNEQLQVLASEQATQVKREPLKHFVLIIDEINRANISRVLGELITLLEPDKRLGQKDELIVKLPSGESFGVPPNLHILGTMNTADKSIAHLDVALRRRFKFIPMYPIAEKAKTHQELLEKLNQEIEEAIGPEFTIGHSYFMTEDTLDQIMNEKVIPLMMEYFNHRTDQVVQILKSADVKLAEKNHFGIPQCLSEA